MYGAAWGERGAIEGEGIAVTAWREQVSLPLRVRVDGALEGRGGIHRWRVSNTLTVHEAAYVC